jgi:hypothetical protein
MIAVFILVISLVQIGLYYLSRTSKLRWLRPVILLAVLSCHVFVFPRLFYPAPSIDGTNCGMPVLGITLAFWIFGTVAAITTHFTWSLIRKKFKLG